MGANLIATSPDSGVSEKSFRRHRATKAVSLIPPAYYADLACERARLYLNRSLNLADSDAQSTVGSSKGGGKKRTKETHSTSFLQQSSDCRP